MIRRTSRFAMLSILLLTTLTCSTALATEIPVVLQLNDPTFSSADRAAITSGITQLDAVLGEGYPVRVSQLASLGWTDRDFVVFVAGYLNSAGLQAVVVEGEDGNGAHHLWILVGIPTGGQTAWIPVEAVPSVVGTSSRLGFIPWLGSSQTEFEPTYAVFSHVVDLAARSAPTVKIVVVGYPVVGSDTALHASSSNSQNIVAFLWSVEGDDEVYIETHGASFKYEFSEPGKTEVTLVVYDRWGGRGTATKVVDVSADQWDCGCND